jgi:hypothetical protein
MVNFAVFLFTTSDTRGARPSSVLLTTSSPENAPGGADIQFGKTGDPA